MKMAVLAAGTVAVAGAVTYGLARPYFKYTVNCHFCDADSKVSNSNNIDYLVYNRKQKSKVMPIISFIHLAYHFLDLVNKFPF